MRHQTLVTATEYGVSTTSASGVEGLTLDVYKIVQKDKSGPPPWYDVEYAVREMPFATQDEADVYCLEHGWLKVYVHKE